MRRQDLGVAAELSDFQTACCQPRAAGNVLRVTELRGRDFFAAKISGRGEFLVGLDHKRRATIGRAGDEADLGAARSRVSIQGWSGTDVGEIDRLGEDGFHRARAGVVNEPLDLSAGAEAFFKPAFALPAEVVSYERLSVRDVWKMTDPERGVVGRGCGGRHQEREGENGEADCFHRRKERGAEYPKTASRCPSMFA